MHFEENKIMWQYPLKGRKLRYFLSFLLPQGLGLNANTQVSAPLLPDLYPFQQKKDPAYSKTSEGKH